MLASCLRVLARSGAGRLGDIQRLTGDYVIAADSQSRALRLYRDLGHRIGEAQTLNSMGELSLECSSPDQARARHEQALKVAHAITAPLEEARALEGIGRCHLCEGRAEDGTALLQQALDVYRRINSPHAGRVEAALRAASG
jgi:tetratricopeptide (TPR) repeat protein